MTIHPEINHLAREERIRTIAYAIWEEEGRPEGCAGAHWLKASALVEAEAEPRTAPAGDVTSPEWLKREPLPEAPASLEQLTKRLVTGKAA